MKQHRVFYGWIVAAAGAGVMGVAIGIINNCFGLLVVPICAELGFGRQDVAVNQTLLNLAAMIVAMLSGVLFTGDRLKKWMRAGAVLMCVFYGCFAFMRSLPAFYAVAMATGLAQGMVNVVPFSIIISQWFREKRGMALGIVYMGSGVGGMLFSALGGQWISALGWRATVLVFDAILFLICVPLVFFVIRTSPAECGQLPLGEAPQEQAAVAPQKASRWKPPLSPAFFVIAVDIIFAALAVNGIASTSTPYYEDIFHSGVISANLTSSFMASLALGKFLLGSLYDRLGAARATALTRTLLIATLFALYMGREPVFVGLFVVCSGMAAATNSISIPFLAKAIDASDTVALTGLYSGLQSFGSLLAPVFCGWVCDRTGSYAQAYLLCGAAVAAMLPSLLLTLHRRPGAS